MIRQHPKSTLFPYTTLLRSTGQPDRLSWFDREVDAAHRRHVAAFRAVRDAQLAQLEHTHGASPRSRGDRKSTRLNSSHANISYAAFCLKKQYFLRSK